MNAKEKIIISINPQYVDKIISGEKKFEYRKRVAKKDIESIIVYCTYPRKLILAEVKIDGIIAASPEKLWESTKEKSGVTKEFFFEYFKDKKMAYAYKLGEILFYQKPLTLSEVGLTVAPQSYAYLKSDIRL